MPSDEVAAAFYVPFREFVDKTYDRTRYETLHILRELFVQQLSAGQTLTQLLLPISRMVRQDAVRALRRHTRGFDRFQYGWKEQDDPEDLGDTYPTSIDPARLRGWETASRARRLRMLRALLRARIYFSGSCTRVKALRSRVIEKYVLPRLARRERAFGTCAVGAVHSAPESVAQTWRFPSR